MTIRRTVRQTLTIARRDFVATVFTPIFLLFLFAPVLMGAFGGLVGGLGAASVAGTGSNDRARIVAIIDGPLAHPVADADTRLRGLYRSDDDAPPALLTMAPAGDAAAQAHRAFSASDYDAAAVLYGPLAKPTILYAPRGDRAADYLAALAEATLAGNAASVYATKTLIAPPPTARAGPQPGAFFAVFGVFFLTLFLSGQVVGSMVEERNNKVIEVLAAAVPLESVFLGKLLGMFGSALVFIAFWGTVVANIGALLPPGMAAGLAGLHPAVGLPAFPLLFLAYFTMAYLLLGAVFLGVGAQATTPREIQMLSLPITFTQIGMLGLSSAAVSHPGSTLAWVAQVFPLSSPFAMAGFAANSPQLWPHAAALAWQLLWVAIFVTVGARAFRRGVLQSGSARPRFRSRGARNRPQAY